MVRRCNEQKQKQKQNGHKENIFVANNIYCESRMICVQPNGQWAIKDDLCHSPTSNGEWAVTHIRLDLQYKLHYDTMNFNRTRSQERLSFVSQLKFGEQSLL